MKKLFLVLFVLAIMAFPVHAQTWHTADQGTMYWDACTLASGDPVPAEDTLDYIVYLQKEGEAPIAWDITTDTNYTFTFTEEGRYFAGVSCRRTIHGQSEPQTESATCWSNVVSCARNGEIFGLAFFEVVTTPSGLRVLQ